MLVVHLNKSGSKMTSVTACGRNILRTPLSTNWTEFKNLPHGEACAKCTASKQAELNTRADAKNEQAEIEENLGSWIPEENQEAIMQAELEMIRKHRSK